MIELHFQTSAAVDRLLLCHIAARASHIYSWPCSCDRSALFCTLLYSYTASPTRDMRKSVAEQLAELATPAPAADPEAADALDDGPGIFESDEELAAADTRSSRRAPEKRQRHAAIHMDSQIYRGRKASRQDIFNAGSPPASSSEDSDIPGLSMTLNRSITHPDSGLGQRNQSPDQIDEDEWGSDGDDTGSEGGLSEDMGTDDSGTEQGSSSDDHEPAADASDAEVLKRLPSRWKPEAEAPRRRGLLKRGGDGAADARESSPRDTSASEGEVSDGEGEDDSGNDTDDDGIDAGANRQGSIGMDEDDGENDMEAVMEAHSLVLHQQLRAKVKVRRERCKGTGWAKLEADYATIQAAPTESKPQSGVAAQTAKAASVANQVKLWERALAVRITLQRGLVAADRLPRGAAYAQTLASAEGAAAKVDAAKREAAAVLGDCMDAVHALIARTVEGTAVPGAAGGGPGSQATERGAEPGACEAVWPLVEALEARFQGFRDEEVDRWHRRTLLASGQVAMRGAGLQALNQPLSRQVAEVLRNPDRALARTRRRRQEHDRVLCEPAAAPRVAPGHGDDAPEGTGEDEVAVAQEGGRAELDGESYNDAAFYQLLLQEFLEAAETDGRVSGVAQVPKSRKAVDRRASKGRKVRYHVMPKLVNFMVPVEDKYPEADDRISALFTNLFGQQSQT